MKSSILLVFGTFVLCTSQWFFVAAFHNLDSPAQEIACPDPGEIFPCQCSRNEDQNLVLICQFVESNERLNEIFDAYFPEKTFYGLEIYLSTISEISNLPEGVSFKKIFIANMPDLSSISDIAFLDSADTLEYLYLGGTGLTSADFIANFSYLYTKLEELDLGFTAIDTIPLFEFDSLVKFSMEYAAVTNISEGAMRIEYITSEFSTYQI